MRWAEGVNAWGPILAARQALQRAGWDIRSVERVEINEAFAAIASVVTPCIGGGQGTAVALEVLR